MPESIGFLPVHLHKPHITEVRQFRHQQNHRLHIFHLPGSFIDRFKNGPVVGNLNQKTHTDLLLFFFLPQLLQAFPIARPIQGINQMSLLKDDHFGRFHYMAHKILHAVFLSTAR